MAVAQAGAAYTNGSSQVAAEAMARADAIVANAPYAYIIARRPFGTRSRELRLIFRDGTGIIRTSLARP